MEQEAYEQQFDDFGLEPLPNKISHKTSQYQQLHLKYSYSGISNNSSNNQFMMVTARSFNEEFDKLKFIQSEKLYESIKILIDELSPTLMIHQDLILYLLYQYKWNIQKLYEQYYEKQVSQTYRNYNQKIIQLEGNIPTKYGDCQVCLLEGNLYSNCMCEHHFCQNCWKQYIKQSLNQNKLFFGCMSMGSICKQMPVLRFFIEFIASSQLDLFYKRICINYSVQNKTISYCPSPACLLFCQKPVTMHQNFVQCPCGTRYCFKCENQPHQPATCSQVQKWQKITNKSENNQKWIEKYTKKCPKCKQSVEKYVGCNQIKCICGCQFCFICSNVWDETHKAHPQICTCLKNNVHLQNKNSTSDKFQQLNDKVILIARTNRKDIQTIKKCLQLVQDEGIREKLSQLSTFVHEMWMCLKWSLIVLYMSEKKPIQIQLERDLIKSIQKLMICVQKLSKSSNLRDTRQLIHLKQNILHQKQCTKKAQIVWLDAWKNSF